MAATKSCLTALPLLADLAAEQAGDHWRRDVLHAVTLWVRQVRQLADVGREETWTRPPRAPGSLPPSCPRCRCYSLRVSRELGLIRCTNPSCRDKRGQPYERAFEDIPDLVPAQRTGSPAVDREASNGRDP